MGDGKGPPEQVSSGWEGTGIQKSRDSPQALTRLRVASLCARVSCSIPGLIAGEGKANPAELNSKLKIVMRMEARRAWLVYKSINRSLGAANAAQYGESQKFSVEFGLRTSKVSTRILSRKTPPLPHLQQHCTDMLRDVL